MRANRVDYLIDPLYLPAADGQQSLGWFHVPRLVQFRDIVDLLHGINLQPRLGGLGQVLRRGVPHSLQEHQHNARVCVCWWLEGNG